MTRAYEEIIDFIAGGPTTDNVANWCASETVKDRVAELPFAEKSGTLGMDDRSELSHLMELEHIMRLAKARARKHLDHE